VALLLFAVPNAERLLANRTLSFRFQKSIGRVLFQNLHYCRRRSCFGLADQDVNMLGHHYISHNLEAVLASDLLESVKEHLTRPSCNQKRPATIAAASDEMQIPKTVNALESAGHSAAL
jgi:hypothetical protein